MPLVDDASSVEQMQPASGGGGSLGNAKWWLVGGIGLILVFVLLKKKGGGSGKAGSSQQVGSQSNIDPSTGFPVGSSADVAALRTYGALGGGGRFNMGSYPTAKGGTGTTNVGGIGLGGSYLPPYEPVSSVWAHGLPEPSFPVGPAGNPGPGNIGATGVNNADLTSGSQALTTQSTVPVVEKSRMHTRLYKVRPGDNLAGIATKYGIAGGSTTLLKNNRNHLGANPDMLIPGTLIYI